MNAVVKLMPPLIRGDTFGPGIVRVHSGKLIDLANVGREDIAIGDIAWSLAKLIRYNGHIPFDYTVARHSVIMSYFVPEENAMEALLHDSGEAFCGDIIQPLKRLFPELEDFEDAITAQVMLKYNDGKQVSSVSGKPGIYYTKSDVIAHADVLIYQHECYRFGRPGQYVAEMHEAERTAMVEVGLGSVYHHGMEGDRDAFLNRFYKLRTMNL